MNSGAITKRYATALLRLTQENGSGDRVCAQVLRMLRDPSSLPSPMEPDLHAFLMLLVRNDRTPYLQRILRTFVDLHCEATGLSHVILTSAVPSEALEKQVRETIESSTGTKVLLESDVDPSLIGGYRVEVGGMMLDASVRRQFELLERNFIEKNNRIV
ncbi:MAG: ATP synthase F1 subunit delta [Bacteroidales bacterium]|nr:ATP synthase F1 subunit delta [Bacteroidales bacterium]